MTNGRWPSIYRRISDDFLPKRWAPNNEGAVAPEFKKPKWIERIPREEGCLEVSRRAHDEAKHSVKIIEEKGNRLARTSLTVLGFAFALGIFVLRDMVFFHSFPVWWWIIFGSIYLISLLILLIATFQSLQLDRVGFYHHPIGKEIIDLTGKNFLKKIIEEEERGRQLATWTSCKKVSDLMQARAWFSRGLAFFVVAITFFGITFPILGN